MRDAPTSRNKSWSEADIFQPFYLDLRGFDQRSWKAGSFPLSDAFVFGPAEGSDYSGIRQPVHVRGGGNGSFSRSCDLHIVQEAATNINSGEGPAH